MKRPRLAKSVDVRITKRGDTAVIEFVEPGIATTHLRIGPELSGMSDQDILDAFNHVILAQERSRESYVAIEIPEGKPQLEYSEFTRQWSPRGDVLRCRIEDDEDGEKYVEIDDRRLSFEEFGRVLEPYVGWGMRIIFVDSEDLMSTPDIIVRDPD